MKKKSTCWAEIYRKFCSSSIVGTKRDIGQLKSQWASSEASSHKKESRRTGGGLGTSLPQTFTLKIQDLLPGEFTELHNPDDNDSNNEETSQASTVDSDEAVTDGAETKNKIQYKTMKTALIQVYQIRMQSVHSN